MPKPSEIIANKFGHEPTPSQAAFFDILDQFIGTNEDKPIALLKGYAGTGKTTIVSVLVEVLPLFNLDFVLLAPTGRAAKVMSQLSRKKAFTIHKKIYKTKGSDEQGPVFSKTKNYHKNTVFIVDESSMISSGNHLDERNLLDDLFDYVYQKTGNRILFVGDTAQLPPVNASLSAALDAKHLSRKYDCKVYECSLTDITRQALDSGILVNATNLRNQLNQKDVNIKLKTAAHKDIYRMTADRMQDGIQYAYDKHGYENTLIICKSNKSAVMYNHFIRNSLFFREEELEASDLLLIARNNYFYDVEDIPSGFLANGDFIEVRKIKRTEERHGFRYADVEVALVDSDDTCVLDIKLILDALHEHAPALTQEQNNALYQSVMKDYQDLNKKERLDAMKADPYLNAVQVKYAYAMTCHKSQGGQWDAVFVDQGFLSPEQDIKEFIRWTYTAMTRARQELFLVNFDPKFF